MKKIVVVGGGTAGWLTALYLKESLQYEKIIVVESEEIGILGAGEGSTPHLIRLLDYLRIPVSDLIKHCDATIKNGIKFTNWKNSKDFFYHAFEANQEIGFDAINIPRETISSYPSILTNIDKDKNIIDIDVIGKSCELNKVPFIHQYTNQLNPILEYDNFGAFSIHFNALKMANRLKEIGQERGIELINTKIIDIELDESENITSLIKENKEKINVDFVFDCSGFHKLIIGKKFKSKWHSYSQYLPVDSAIPFFIKMDENIPPYTEAIAMKYGWIWKIPLQSRYGCGYVYDSSLISEKEIIKEIEDFLGFEPEYPRKDKGSFKFNAGHFEEVWINNCIAIGLSAGFIEPLEATSIWVSILSLNKILGSSEWLYNNNEEYRKEFNLFFSSLNNQVADFIYFHYMSNRKDTEFWKKFTYENATLSLKRVLNILNYRILNKHDYENSAWLSLSWILVGIGIGKINKKHTNVYKKILKFYDVYNKHYAELVNKQNYFINKFSSHNDFINKLKD